MRTLRQFLIRGLGAVVAGALAVPAAAGTFITYDTTTYSFAFGGSNANTGGPGNSMSFNSTTLSGSAAQISVTAKAYTATKVGTSSTYAFAASEVEQWSGGLGVTSPDKDNPNGCSADGCSNSHQIDNQGNSSGSSSIDLIRLDFTQAVVLGGFKQTVYPGYNSAENGFQYDADYSIGEGVLNASKTALTTGTDINTSLTTTNLASIFTINNSITSCGATSGVTVNSPSCTNTISLYTAAQAPYLTNVTASKTWYVAASILTSPTYGGDSKPDAFKLASLTAYFSNPVTHQSAVPEPSSWMTMIVGFGVAGTALRRSRRQKVATAAA